MSDGDAVLFVEPGARWRVVAYGPLLCLLVLVLEMVTSSPVHWFALIFCGALIAAFVALQVVAGRRHVSVELTESTLRQGTETLPLTGVTAVLPERDEHSWNDEEWESARALGELSGVPRRRKGIGLRLGDGGLVQAWARDHRGLRTALATALRPEDVEAQDKADDAELQRAEGVEEKRSAHDEEKRSADGMEASPVDGIEEQRTADGAEALPAEGIEEQRSENGADR
ncbi:hypothetical protein [Nocardia sp. bgisy118]|uniref:hypothetical protein n=1 Tax=Nocardia sp. bgisy118 TaxID=3413786 RepID=UPI003F49B790